MTDHCGKAVSPRAHGRTKVKVSTLTLTVDWVVVDWVGVGVGEAGKQLLIDGRQKTVVGRSQLRFLHREH